MSETTMPQNSFKPLVKATMKAIQSICSDLKLDRTVPCTIHKVYEPDEKQNLYRYDVVINNSTYKLYSAVGDIFKEHDKVWVTYPCGNMQNGYISGRRFLKYGNTCYK